jgi:hypothetical protein
VSSTTKPTVAGVTATTGSPSESLAKILEQLAAIIPDLSKVTASSLETKGDYPSWATSLVYRAIDEAALKVVDRIFGAEFKDPAEKTPPPTPDSTSGNRVVYITSESDLVVSSFTYNEVRYNIRKLLGSCRAMLDHQGDVHADLVPVTALTAIASTLPSILSLFSAARSINATSITASDLAAAAAVAECIRARGTGAKILHDGFALMPEDELLKEVFDLTRARNDLGQLKGRLAGSSDAPDGEEKRNANLSEIESLISMIDTYIAAIHAVPASGQRSLLATAALYERIQKVSHVLLVKAQAGQAKDMLDNRPLWWADRFSTVVDASITFMLIDRSSSELKSSGTLSGRAELSGRIGKKITA